MPPAVVLGTDVFDRFLDENDLRDFAIECDDDAEIDRRFRGARFPEEAGRDLLAFLERVRWPLAVRSSSLLEDSQYQPFTGVYETFMLPNNAASVAERWEHDGHAPSSASTPRPSRRTPRPTCGRPRTAWRRRRWR